MMVFIFKKNVRPQKGLHSFMVTLEQINYFNFNNLPNR